MPGALLEGLFVVLLWVGLWNVIETIIGKIAKNDENVRFVIYVLIILIAIFFFWIFQIELI